jgi:hypothetical protein
LPVHVICCGKIERLFVACISNNEQQGRYLFYLTSSTAACTAFTALKLVGQPYPLLQELNEAAKAQNTTRTNTCLRVLFFILKEFLDMIEILVVMFAKRAPTTVYYGAGFNFAAKISVFPCYGFLLPGVSGN